MSVVEVDGSYGEGGGQILRYATAFSVIFKRPVVIKNIRAGREKPGLRVQHLSALKILSAITSADMSGAYVGSTEVFFSPKEISTKKLSYDLGTAASITLVLQTLIPAVSLSGKELELSITGGTDVPWSPTFDYLEKVVRSVFEKIGIRFEVSAARRGYYPRGGGIVNARIHASRGIEPLLLRNKPDYSVVEVISRCGMLPVGVAERQKDAAREFLISSGITQINETVSLESSLSPGSSVLVFTCRNGCFIGSDSIGRKGVRAEIVGREAAERFVEVVRRGSCLDFNMPDMIAPLLTLSSEASELVIPDVTNHLRTSMYVASLFNKFDYSYEKLDGSYLLRIRKR